jgi:Zn-dependent M16 (insulinase) family peptidase
MGTATQDFIQLSQRIGRDTGGILVAPLIAARRHSPACAAYLFLRGKATLPQAGKLFAILEDMLLSVKLDNPERFRQMVQEQVARAEAQLVPAGHRMVHYRLNSKFSQAGWAIEQVQGLSQLQFLRRLEKQVSEDWQVVLATLEDIRRRLVTRPALLINTTLDKAGWQKLQPRLASFLGNLPATPPESPAWQPAAAPTHEAFTLPAQVNYVAKGADLYSLGYALDGSALVVNGYLQATYLWEKIRVQGGAYGGLSLFDMNSGVFDYLSYRDPNLSASLDNYDGTPDFLRDLRLSQEELVKSIIGAIGVLDAYQLPDAKGFTSLTRYLTGMNDDLLQSLRDQVLTTTLADFKAFGEALAPVVQSGQVVVLGSPEAIQAANQQRGGFLEITKIM